MFFNLFSLILKQCAMQKEKSSERDVSRKKNSHCVLLDPRPESTESVYEDDEDVGGGEDLKR